MNEIRWKTQKTKKIFTNTLNKLISIYNIFIDISQDEKKVSNFLQFYVDISVYRSLYFM